MTPTIKSLFVSFPFSWCVLAMFPAAGFSTAAGPFVLEIKAHPGTGCIAFDMLEGTQVLGARTFVLVIEANLGSNRLPVMMRPAAGVAALTHALVLKIIANTR